VRWGGAFLVDVDFGLLAGPGSSVGTEDSRALRYLWRVGEAIRWPDQTASLQTVEYWLNQGPEDGRVVHAADGLAELYMGVTLTGGWTQVTAAHVQVKDIPTAIYEVRRCGHNSKLVGQLRGHRCAFYLRTQ